MQKRRHSTLDLAQAQQMDRGQGTMLQGGCAVQVVSKVCCTGASGRVGV